MQVLSATRSGTTFWERPPAAAAQDRGARPVTRMPLPPTPKPSRVYRGHRSADDCGINTQHTRRVAARQIIKMHDDDETYVSCGRKTNKTISDDENFLISAVRHTVQKTSSPSAVATVIGVKLKRMKKKPNHDKYLPTREQDLRGAQRSRPPPTTREPYEYQK